MESSANSTRRSGSEPKIALCLSGGGFRATLFHLGSLRRLNEFGILSRIRTVCSVSGGSITNGVLATRWNALMKSEKDGGFTEFDDLLAKPLHDFCRADLRTTVLFWDRTNPINWPKLMRTDYSVTDRLALQYAEHLQLDVPLSATPGSPSFIFCGTNMANGGCWTFRREKMGDWYTGYAAPGTVTVAQAVAASSAYPITFPPLWLSLEGKTEFRGGHGKRDEIQKPESVTITDGGVYDNLGLEPAREGHDVVLVSDAGRPLDHEEMTKLNPYARVTRALDIIWNQVGAQRKRWLIDAFTSPVHSIEGAYWGLTSEVAHYGLPDAPAYSDAVVELLGKIRTDLDEFSTGEIACLENQGYALANVAVRRWTKDLVPDPAPQFSWPYPEYAQDQVACEAIRTSGQRGIFRDLWKSIKNQARDWF